MDMEEWLNISCFPEKLTKITGLNEHGRMSIPHSAKNNTLNVYGVRIRTSLNEFMDQQWLVNSLHNSYESATHIWGPSQGLWAKKL